MFAKIKIIIQVIKFLWETYQWIDEKIDDITYHKKKNARKQLIKAIGEKDEEKEMDALEQLGK